MKRYLSAAIVTGVAALSLPAIAAASATITVEPAPFVNSFSPANSSLDLGDGSFDWEWGPGGAGAEDVHNVVQGKTSRSGKPLFGSGAPQTERPGGFSVTASAGSFPYFCQVHLGMDGVASVRPTVTDRPGSGVRVSWASAETTTGNRFDVRYRAGKKWKPWRKKTKKTSGVFGRKGKPAKAGKKVKVQARSRQGKARSDWSPKVPLVPQPPPG